MRKTGGVALIGAMLVLACGARDDTEEAVRAALEQADLRDVQVVRENDALRLTGTVDTLAERTRAVELAEVLAGTSAEVRNEIAVTGLGPLGESTPGRSPAGEEP